MGSAPTFNTEIEDDTENVFETSENIDELSNSEIESIANDIGIEKKYIDKSVELKRADERLAKYNRKKELDRNKSNKVNKNKIKTFLSYIRSEIYPTPSIPNFASVTSIDTPKDSSYIVLHTETEYPSLLNDYKDNLTKSFRFDLSNDKDLYKINYILKSMNINSICNLDGKSIPIQPYSDTDYKYDRDIITYKLSVPEKTILSRLNNKFHRLSMKFNCIERQSPFWSKQDYGDYCLNRNITLLFFLVMLPLSLLNDTILVINIIVLTIFYVLPIIIGFGIGLSELISKESGNRNHIKRKIIK